MSLLFPSGQTVEQHVARDDGMPTATQQRMHCRKVQPAAFMQIPSIPYAHACSQLAAPAGVLNRNVEDPFSCDKHVKRAGLKRQHFWFIATCSP